MQPKHAIRMDFAECLSASIIQGIEALGEWGYDVYEGCAEFFINPDPDKRLGEFVGNSFTAFRDSEAWFYGMTAGESKIWKETIQHLIRGGTIEGVSLVEIFQAVGNALMSADISGGFIGEIHHANSPENTHDFWIFLYE